MFDLKKHEVRKCSVNEFNIILSKIARPLTNESAQGKNINSKVYCWQSDAKAFLVFNDFTDSKIVTRAFETDLNGNYIDGYLEYMQSTSTHCRTIAKAIKLPKLINDKSEAKVAASGILWNNDKLVCKKQFIYEYDMHLAWLTTFMTCPLPDTTFKPRSGTVGKNEIGFVKNGYKAYNCGDSVVFEGDYADYIFPIMYCPNLKYCNNLVKQIDTEKHPLKRKDKKSRFNEWLGQEQNRNDFIRVAVIAQSNKKIIDLINKYENKLVFSVTDSLGATERIPELDNLNNWTIKSQGIIYLVNNTRIYLDENDKIIDACYRGVPKQHLLNMSLEEFIELKKYVNIEKNIYKLDINQRRIINNEI